MNKFEYINVTDQQILIPDEFLNIYKYTNAEACKLILSTLSLRFQHPAQFNDPFDCRMNGIFFNHKFQDKDCKNDLAILKKEFLQLARNPNLIDRAYEHSVQEKLKTCGISCFSTDGNNQLMWAHYADKHKGICLGFSNFEQPFVNAKIDVIGTMNYGKFPKVNYCANKIKGLARIFLTKSIDWKYEKEVRLLTLSGAKDHVFKPDFCKALHSVYALILRKSVISKSSV
jgi:hypothetical protein